MLQQSLARLYDRLGDAHFQLDDVSTAREYFDRSFKIRQELGQADPKNTLNQFRLAYSLRNQAGERLKAGDPAAARDLFQKALKIYWELEAADPSNKLTQMNLVLAHNQLGGLYVETGEFSAARNVYGQSLKHAERLLGSDPSNDQIHLLRLAALHGLGQTEIRALMPEKALSYYEQMQTLLTKMEKGS